MDAETCELSACDSEDNSTERKPNDKSDKRMQLLSNALFSSELAKHKTTNPPATVQDSPENNCIVSVLKRTIQQEQKVAHYRAHFLSFTRIVVKKNHWKELDDCYAAQQR